MTQQTSSLALRLRRFWFTLSDHLLYLRELVMVKLTDTRKVR